MTLDTILAGAAAGCTATVPMTLVMELLHRQLPAKERYPLPPRQITMEVARRTDVLDEMNESERLGTTLAAHFAMGTAAGSLYPLLGRSIPLPSPLRGAAYGLAVWAVNYLAILPALDILRPATQHPPRRTGLMIAAHLVWGAVTASLLDGER